MIIEIPDDNSIVKWKYNDKDEWKVAEILDLIKAYESSQGEWITHHIPYTYMGYTHFSCSECNYVDDIKLGQTFNFCPNCGAKMKGGVE